MNVLIASHLFPNRVEPLKGVFVSEFATALKKLASVEVLAPVSVIPLVRSYSSLPVQDVQGGLTVHHPRYFALPAVMFQWRWGTYYQAIHRWFEHSTERPDIIHVHWAYPDAYAVLRMARRHGIKVVLTVHGHAAFGWQGPASHKKYYHEVLEEVAHIIPVSAQLKDELVAEFDLPASKLTVIHNGVDIAKFPPLSRSRARRKLGLPQNKKVILTVARLSPEKGLDRLVEQLSLCLGNHDWELHILGMGPCEQDLRAQITSLGLGNRVLLEGGIPHAELNEWYRAADLFCLSSYHEGCPVVIHEAMATGLPVVSTKVGAVPDILRPDVDGLLCDVSRDTDLSVNIDRAMGMQWDSDRIEKRGRECTWDKVASKTMSIYESVLGRQAG